MSLNKTYWKGLDEKSQSPEFIAKATKEFQDDLPIEEFVGSEEVSGYKTGRRDFLKYLGFGVAAATLASCETPVIKSVPYTNKPEEITPGVANWYASTFFDGNDFANILVKSREGRPIWIKGNKSFGITNGGLTPRINASVLNLYNSDRLKDPMIGDKADTWATVDGLISAEMKAIAKSGGQIVLMTNTLASPSTEFAISQFIEKIGGSVKWVKYDAVSLSAMREANAKSFGEPMIPNYHFDKAGTVVSINADFLSNWLMPAKFSADFGKTRNPNDGEMSRHFQFETVMTLSGANADYRTMVRPSENSSVAAAILKHVGGKDLGITVSDKIDAAAKKAAESLLANKGKSIVIAGVNDVATQVVVNAINEKLGNYGKTIDLSTPLMVKQGNDAEVKEVVDAVIGGTVKGLILYGVNPVYTLPNGKEFGEALANVSCSVSFSEFADETASKCKYTCPNHNYLESWNDVSVQWNNNAVQQPLIRPLNNTRQAQESLLVWAGLAERGGRESKVYYNFMRAAWMEFGFPNQTEHATFEEYWNWSVHNGTTVDTSMPAPATNYTDATGSIVGKITGNSAAEFEVLAYTTGEIGEGQYTANPWLQELPNAITKVTWDNYITMNIQDACKLIGIDWDVDNQISSYNALHLGQEEKAYVASIKVGEQTLELPIFPLPGQARGTVGVALGYGRGEGNENIGKAAYQVALDQSGEYIMKDNKRVPIGGNSYKFTSVVDNQMQYHGEASLSLSDERYSLACTQTHHTIMGRDSIVKETTMDVFKAALDPKDPTTHADYNPPHMLHVHSKGGPTHVATSEVDLWDEHPVEMVGHRWAMTVDLSSCNGCGVCIVACHSENNVPVVGKDEVRRARDMHWLRLDRYFSSIDEDKRDAWNKDKMTDVEWSYDNLEVPEESPSVVFMPMMCQHCNHAPCETVCPVAATTHSNEGLNMMAYNRCIGTRYCGNNCPYKVRRFNWFNYRDYKKFSKVNNAQDEMSRMVLNPDVTVRSRGVMEKCTFCVQRIQEGKLNAKAEGRRVVDGDVVSACADSCPTGAISFGDWNDMESNVHAISQEGRTYQALEEIGVKPNVFYQTLVRNVDEPMVEKHTEEKAH
jgi:MoCo/4Fe-4S cofactor protein with predicted Tat translocation signal